MMWTSQFSNISSNNRKNPDMAEEETIGNTLSEDRLDEDLVGLALADLDDDAARTGIRCSEDDLNRAAERHRLSVLELAQLRQRAEDQDLVSLPAQSPDSTKPLELEPSRQPAAVDTSSSISILISQLRAYPLLDAAGETALARRIENGLKAQQFLAKHPDAANREQLQRAASDGLEAKQRMVGCNVRLVINNAKDFRGQGLDFDDLVQAAMPGLIRAAEKFDHRKGFKFSTYATWWIRQSIARALADTGRMIRLPVHVVERLNKFRAVRARKEAQLGREPSLEELAEALEWDLAEVTALVESIPTIVSLDTPLSRDGDSFTIADLVASDAPTPYEEAVVDIQRELVRELLEELEPRERKVIESRHGLAGAPKTLEEIGRTLGVSRERVRQIERNAMGELRQRALEKGFPR